jgi:hypothetical protein
MSKFDRGSVIDVAKIFPPKERVVFQGVELEGLFNLDVPKSIMAWNALTAERLKELIEQESSVSGRPAEEIKEMLKKRMATVEKGLNLPKHDNPSLIESTILHMRALANSF